MDKMGKNLLNVVNRAAPPEPWAEGDNIPWNDPDFSERMLREHLSQQHDLASRRGEVIDAHVRWIHETVLGGKPARVLDLACGPGLYANRLAALGHECTGIDFSPASIAYARKTAEESALPCTYRLEDVRNAAFGEGFDLAMMLYGQINVFRRAEVASILRRTFDALKPGGMLLLEPQRFEAIRSMADAPAAWSSSGDDEGLFQAPAHLCLSEAFWHEEASATTQRWFIIDARSDVITRYAMTTEAYEKEDLLAAIADAGFEGADMLQSLLGAETGDPSSPTLFTIVGRKPTTNKE